MANLTSLLSTARDALSAQAYGITVTGQNISNVNTPGYTRREAVLQTRAFGSGSYGGVNVAGLRQVSDRFLDRAQLMSLGQEAAARQHNGVLAGVEAVLNDAAGSGLGSSLDALFNSFGQLAARPNDPTARGEVLFSAENLAANVRSVADELATTREELLTKAREIVQQVNSRSKELAQLNRQIQVAEAQGKDAADLKDQRSQRLLDLAGLIDVRTTIDGDGGVLVHSAGTVLVEGGNARSLGIDLDGGGGIKLVSLISGGGGTDVTRFLTGGSLAGVKEARDVDVFAVAQRLDEFVFDVGNTINAQHALGTGLDGETGRNLFDVPSTSAGAARVFGVSADVAGNPAAVAAAGDGTTLPGGSDNAVALAALGDAALGSTGRSVFQSYGDIVGDIATRKSAAQKNADMRAAVHAQNEAMRESLSGVSLDEEMVSLMKYQTAYQAAAKVLSTVDEMLQELLSRVG